MGGTGCAQNTGQETQPKDGNGQWGIAANDFFET